jgi:hypothetical protein
VSKQIELPELTYEQRKIGELALELVDLERQLGLQTDELYEAKAEIERLKAELRKAQLAEASQWLEVAKRNSVEIMETLGIDHSAIDPISTDALTAVKAKIAEAENERLLDALVIALAGQRKAEFLLEHRFATENYCRGCGCYEYSTAIDKRHNYTDDDWKREARGELAKP